MVTDCESDSLNTSQTRLQQTANGFQTLNREVESEDSVTSEGAGCKKVFFKVEERAGVKRKVDELSHDDDDFDAMDIDGEEVEGPEEREAKRIRLF